VILHKIKDTPHCTQNMKTRYTTQRLISANYDYTAKPGHRDLHITRHEARNILLTSTPVGGSLPPSAGAKFKILLCRSFVPWPIEYICQFHRRRPTGLGNLGFKMLTSHWRMDGLKDRHLTGFTIHLGRDD